MNKRLWSFLLLILVILISAWWLARPGPMPPRRPESAPPVSVASKQTAPPVATAPGPLAEQVPPAATPAGHGASPPSPPAPPPQPDDTPHPEQVRQLEKIALDIRHFSQRFGGNPVGTNQEIVKTLRGGNQARANYLAASEYRLNDQGEIIDTWGTPYFFHANSATHMEVRSAGPDKVLWTQDDIIGR